MVKKVKALITKYWEVLIYLVFGVLTTVVNYVIYLPVYNILGLSAALSNAIAWVGAVVGAWVGAVVGASVGTSVGAVVGGLLLQLTEGTRRTYFISFKASSFKVFITGAEV